MKLITPEVMALALMAICVISAVGVGMVLYRTLKRTINRARRRAVKLVGTVMLVPQPILFFAQLKDLID